MKHFLPALRMLIFMTLITGIVYPLSVSTVAQGFFSKNANGQLLERGGVIVGSQLLGQNFEKENYFWGRPSGVGYNPQPSGGTNLGMISADLKKAVEERRAKLLAANPDSGEPPQDLLFSSGSGLDPHISPEAAKFQLKRVARARGLNEEQMTKLLESNIEGRQFGFLGEPRVNVLALNLALDQIQGNAVK